MRDDDAALDAAWGAVEPALCEAAEGRAGWRSDHLAAPLAILARAGLRQGPVRPKSHCCAPHISRRHSPVTYRRIFFSIFAVAVDFLRGLLEDRLRKATAPSCAAALAACGDGEHAGVAAAISSAAADLETSVQVLAALAAASPPGGGQGPGVEAGVEVAVGVAALRRALATAALSPNPMPDPLPGAPSPGAALLGRVEALMTASLDARAAEWHRRRRAARRRRRAVADGEGEGFLEEGDEAVRWGGTFNQPESSSSEDEDEAGRDEGGGDGQEEKGEGGEGGGAGRAEHCWRCLRYLGWLDLPMVAALVSRVARRAVEREVAESCADQFAKPRLGPLHAFAEHCVLPWALSVVHGPDESAPGLSGLGSGGGSGGGSDGGSDGGSLVHAGARAGAAAQWRAAVAEWASVAFVGARVGELFDNFITEKFPESFTAVLELRQVQVERYRCGEGGRGGQWGSNVGIELFRVL